MPNLASAIKEVRKIKTKTARNKALKTKAKNLAKQTLKYVQSTLSEQKELAKTTLKSAIQSIDKAAKHGILKKNTANRKKSALMHKFNKFISGKTGK